MEALRKRINEQLKNLQVDAKIKNVKFDGDCKLTFDYIDDEDNLYPFSVTIDENDISSALVFIDDSQIECARMEADLSKFFSKLLRQKTLLTIIEKFQQSFKNSDSQQSQPDDEEQDISLRTRRDDQNDEAEEGEQTDDDDEGDVVFKDDVSNHQENVDEDGDSRMSQPDDDTFTISKKETTKNQKILEQEIKSANSQISPGRIILHHVSNQYFLLRFALDKSFLSEYHQEVLGLKPDLCLVCEVEFPFQYLSSSEAPKICSKGVYQANREILDNFCVEKQATDEYSLINYLLRDRLTTALKKNWEKKKSNIDFSTISANDEENNQATQESTTEKQEEQTKEEKFIKSFEESEKMLKDLGFSEKVSFYSLLKFKNDPNAAANLLFSQKGIEYADQFDQNPEPDRSKILEIFEEIEKKQQPIQNEDKEEENEKEEEEEEEEDEEVEIVETNYENFLNSQNNFVLGVYLFLQEKLRTCSSNCVNCGEELGFNGIKPTICNKSLCIYQAYQYGLGVDILNEIRYNSKVVDLLISFFWSALMMKKTKRNVLDPYPTLLSYRGEPVTDKSLEALTELIPSVEELRKHCESTQSLRDFLNSKDPDLFPLLRWIISSNRSHLAIAPEHMKIKGIGDNLAQYVMLSQTPEKEAQFREKKAKFGSFYAFHGSGFGNWHCILRKGLKNYSNTEFMAVGAIAGPGIYLANNLQISGGYSSKFVSSNWKNSAFLGTPFCCSVCEVLNTPNYTQSDIDILGGSIPVSSRQTSISIPASSSSSQKTSHKVKHNVATGDSKAAIDYTKFPWGYTVQNEDVVCTRIFLVGNKFENFPATSIKMGSL